MAFTETQINEVAKVLKFNLDDLRAHLVYRSELVTPEIIADVMDLVTAYRSIAVSGVEFMPTESNRGFKKTPETQRSDLRDDIRFLLNLGGSSQSNRLLRS